MSNIRMMLKLTAQAKKQPMTMKRRLMAYWLSLVLATLSALVLVLAVAGVFSNHSKAVEEGLQLQLSNAEMQTAQHMDGLMAQGIAMSQQISRTLNQTLTVQGMSVSTLNDRTEVITGLQTALFDVLNTTLHSAECSGAFVILNATTNTQVQGADHSATGLYLRFANFNAKGAAEQNVVLFRGIPEVARREGLELHNRWNLEFDTDTFPGYDRVMTSPVGRLADSCFWTDRFQLPGTWEDTILLLVPVLDRDGSVCGVCGLELSELYCYISYPEVDSVFGPMIRLMAPMKDDELLLYKGMSGGLDGTFLGEVQRLTVKEGTHYHHYISDNHRYLGLHAQTSVRGMDGDYLYQVVLIPQTTYDDYRQENQMTWMLASLVFMVVMVCLCKYMSVRFMRPILKTIEVIHADEHLEGNETGISELDDLMAFVNSKASAQALSQGSLPPNIEELFNTFAQRAKTLTTTERSILKYYVDGYEITEIPQLAFISIHTVKKHNSNIYQKLGVASRDELMLYIELFRRCDRLDELISPP